MANPLDFNTFREEMQKTLKEKFGDFACPIWGNQAAKIVSISQAPSLSVIKNKKPFSDKSGEKLRRVWYKVTDEVFYNPDNFYFTAIGMYFPGKDKKGADRKPTYEWAKVWLTKELSYLRPQLYLILGKVAAKYFFPKGDFPQLVFSDQRINETLTFVLPHPSPLNIKWFMDNPDFEKKRLLEVRRAINSVLNT